MRTARDWKTYYLRERERLGEAGLQACLDRADALGLRERLRGADAVVFPHTRLETSGELPAAAALAAVRSGCGTVLALGVLHGARVEDAALVQAARSGDEAARATLRRVHGPGAPDDRGHWEEEFSLDNFAALLDAAARRERLPTPRLVRRFPFLTGDDPAGLPGLDELQALRADPGGTFLAATADPIHHGVGYGTAPAELRPLDDPATSGWARASVREGFDRLAARDYAGFLQHATDAKSDFRDPGPVLAELCAGDLRMNVLELRLVDYADALAAPAPTWVAGALAALGSIRCKFPCLSSPRSSAALPLPARSARNRLRRSRERSTPIRPPAPTLTRAPSPRRRSNAPSVPTTASAARAVRSTGSAPMRSRPTAGYS